MNPELLKEQEKMHLIQVRGKLLSLKEPVVMGILNATPDSFHAASRVANEDEALKQAEKHLKEGAHLLDLGAYSSRPGASEISEDEERRRLLPLVEKISRAFPDVPLSVDTFRSKLAREAIQAGAGMINDISAGDEDPAMLSVIASLRVPLVIMHKKGQPATMQVNPEYKDVVGEVYDYLANKIAVCRNLGIKDIIIDPGFGFGKTNDHNFRLLDQLELFKLLDAPLLAGISRKGMVWKTLGLSSSEALNGSTVLHTVALLKGAKILRVHDVKEAVEAVRLLAALNKFQ
ncbi:MAG: dihydropteroate synthase [Bacteroidia bacterium]